MIPPGEVQGQRPWSGEVRGGAMPLPGRRRLFFMAAAGTFRRDLFYRLGVVRLVLPPLRERPEDIPLLCATLIERQNLLSGKTVTGLTDAALGILLRHDYPGNVRELQNILEYAFILRSSGRLGPEHLPDYLRGDQDAAPAESGPMLRLLAEEA